MTPATAGLPTHFAVVRLACDCFEVRMPELEKMLQIIRSLEQCPDKYFPAKLNRVMLSKAEKENSELSLHLCTVAYRALYVAIRWAEKNPVSGDAAELSERVALGFPRLYSEILKGMIPGPASETEVASILIREVFVPTFFLELAKIRREAHGNEMSVNNCWYLPKELRGKREYPFQRVLGAWLNAAGCRGAEDIGKLLQSEAKRKIVSNWLKGKNVPRWAEIKRLVDSFKNDPDRFEDSQVWKGRLVFAAAMQRLCERLDFLFSKTDPGFSFKMLGMLEQIEKENIPIDCGQVLLGPKTFFTARLIYRRLKQTKEWNKQLAALPTQMNSTIKQAATKTELDEIERKARFEMNSGNLLIKFIQTEILEAKKKKLTEGTALSLYDDIFALGVIEINRMINKKGRQK